MADGNSRAAEAARIRELIEDRDRAVRARDVGAALSGYAPDVLSFDMVNPLQRTGAEAVARRLEEWFSSFQGPIGFETRDLSIAAGDDVGFCHGLNHVSATKLDGGKLDMWWRSTVCCRKIDGRWMITHEHDSVPFDVETGRASLDLEP